MLDNSTQHDTLSKKKEGNMTLIMKAVRIDSKTVKLLEKEAKQAGQTVSPYIRMILENREEIQIVKAIQDKLKK